LFGAYGKDGESVFKPSATSSPVLLDPYCRHAT
jgi:hypothetical protein